MDFERCTLDEVAAALSFVDAHNRGVWLRMGMAVKSEFGADGYDTWDAWSQGADNYKAAAARTVWKGIKSGGGITIATLFAEAISCGYTPEKRELTPAQKAELDRERARRMEKRQAEELAEQELQQRWHGVIAQAAASVWSMLKPVGNSPYLGAKKIQPCGAGFVPHGIVIEFCEDVTTQIHTGKADIDAFFARKTEETSFRYLKPGCLVVPVVSPESQIVNLQIIYSSGKKSFLKHGRKSGCFFMMSSSPAVPADSHIIFAEGFATAASVFLPISRIQAVRVVVAFDSGNLPVVAQSFRACFPTAPFVFAADNDFGVDGNPGISKAQEAAALTGGRVWLPPAGAIAA